MNKLVILDKDNIKNKIFSIRGQQIMLDSDLANFYMVETKQLNRAVKRNRERFPKEFMFQLSESEYGSLMSQSVDLETKSNSLRFQNGTLKKPRGKHRKYLPYVFTEQGIAMLSAILRSEAAVKISVQLTNAFVSMRKFIATNAQIFNRLDQIEIKQIELDKRFYKIFKALETHKPKQGVFFEGQVFDAYELISKLIKSAKRSIMLVDNYVDESVLTLFTKRKKGVNVTIFTK